MESTRAFHCCLHLIGLNEDHAFVIIFITLRLAVAATSRAAKAGLSDSDIRAHVPTQFEQYLQLFCYRILVPRYQNPLIFVQHLVFASHNRDAGNFWAINGTERAAIKCLPN